MITENDIGKRVKFRAWTRSGYFTQTRIIRGLSKDGRYIYVRSQCCNPFYITQQEIIEILD